ncbi:caspase family protein [Pseudophaeobacter sp. EL27]|uniref:caspase family protein n=1 Tax=Pseudophaeobacter sp. EL27 TaxID=2107580 RepID=UPI000EFC7707|nr:caspase family protein [Pseudophaeobacter sp. EL27]
MFSKSLKSVLAAAMFTTSSVGPVFADNLGAALIGGLIGGAIVSGANRNRRATTTRRSSGNSAARTQNKETQTSLNYFGFPAGSPDGVMGRKSRAAISQYQAYMGYPATGQLTEYERGFLTSSRQRALASGFQATQQANSHPDGSKILLKIYLNEQLQQQQQVPAPQMAGVPTTTMVGVPQQYGQQIQPQGGYVGQAPVTMQTYGVQPQVNGQLIQGQGQPVQGYVGQVAQGQVYQGQQVYQRQVPQGQVYQGQQMQGQQVFQGQVYQRLPVPGQQLQGQAAQGQLVQGQQIQGQVYQGQNGQQPTAPQGVAVAALSSPAAAAVTAAVAEPEPSQNVYTGPQIQRRALVIGVDGYENLESLQKARNDALAVSNALVDLGFDVLTLYDASRRDINSAVSTMAGQIEPGDEVLFYFAGHGIEVDGRNYLLPSDVPVVNYGDESFLTGESIPAGRILDTFQRRGARTTVMVLDACRNNPFAQDGKRAVGGARGLVRMDPPEGAFILYSAGAGQTALDRLSDDDENPNSVFTRALLPRLQEPGMSLHDLAKQVRRDVQKLASTVNHEQFPAYYDQMSGDLFLSSQVADQ